MGLGPHLPGSSASSSPRCDRKYGAERAAFPDPVPVAWKCGRLWVPSLEPKRKDLLLGQSRPCGLRGAQMTWLTKGPAGPRTKGDQVHRLGGYQRFRMGGPWGRGGQVRDWLAAEGPQDWINLVLCAGRSLGDAA